MPRKFGFKVVFRKVEKRANGIVPNEIADDWDSMLGITGHTSDTGGGALSEYEMNLLKIRQARVNGLDPYAFEATLKTWGYTSEWTPHGGKHTLEPYRSPHPEGTHGKKQRTIRDDFSGRGTGGIGGRGTRTEPKSIRRKQ